MCEAAQSDTCLNMFRGAYIIGTRAVNSSFSIPRSRARGVDGRVSHSEPSRLGSPPWAVSGQCGPNRMGRASRRNSVGGGTDEYTGQREVDAVGHPGDGGHRAQSRRAGGLLPRRHGSSRDGQRAGRNRPAAPARLSEADGSARRHRVHGQRSLRRRSGGKGRSGDLALRARRRRTVRHRRPGSVAASRLRQPDGAAGTTGRPGSGPRTHRCRGSVSADCGEQVALPREQLRGREVPRGDPVDQRRRSRAKATGISTSSRRARRPRATRPRRVPTCCGACRRSSD